MALLYLLPFLQSIYRSFIEAPGAFGLGNYAKAWALYRRDMFFSLAVGVLSTAAAVPVSILISSYLRLSTGSAARAVNLLYRLPIFIPFVVVGQMMVTFLAPHGLLNVGLAQAGVISMERPLQLFNLGGLAFAFVWKQMAFMTLIVLSGFRTVDETYVEAARSVGAGAVPVVTRVLVPMSRATIAVAIILVFSSTVGAFTLPFMFIGGRSPTTITVDIAHRVTYFGDWGAANALGVTLYLLVFATAIYYLRHMVRRGVYGY